MVPTPAYSTCTRETCNVQAYSGISYRIGLQTSSRHVYGIKDNLNINYNATNSHLASPDSYNVCGLQFFKEPTVVGNNNNRSFELPESSCQHLPLCIMSHGWSKWGDVSSAGYH